MAEALIVLGAGGHARSVLALLNSLQRPVHAVLDPAAQPGETIMGVPVLAELALTAPCVLAVGDNQRRAVLFKQHQQWVLADALIHPSALLDATATLGKASQVLALAYIGPMARLGLNCLVNTRAVMEHESCLGDHSHLSVGAVLLGRAQVGAYCFIGAGAVIKDGVSLCDGVVVGANAFVNVDITEPGTYVGTPIRRLC
ncbi:NeuD/PglB/VioB family sugar acetyltransferase [Alkalimonas amylolytica]|uniref:Sugar O-acyltransferase, sialic acid O-acetyltransferase NeuD family n=1 Tax=Alkalimonas amylolytica TaxID=152573 RepID=A0A1H4B892_ALKAM|nr:NeuD/PglB/VioB family sugar acetyltransferase [Alkalimonas amylolytica]SEA44383.1 sugar O-acyltransferase, sialic acid O-acetyltransferase NeuD family [Alkalimonas amylolytica]